MLATAFAIAEIVFLTLVLCPGELGKTCGTPISREQAIGESVKVLLLAILAYVLVGLVISYVDRKLKKMDSTQPVPRV